MKTDKTKLLQDIEAMKEKLASMEEELNKSEIFKHFPSKGDKYYYTHMGVVCSNEASSNDLKVNVYKTREEAVKAYNKAVAIEKIKRRILELQGDWKPDWTDNDENKICILYVNGAGMFIPTYWFTTHQYSPIPYMKSEEIALTIIEKMEAELKLIFDID